MIESQVDWLTATCKVAGLWKAWDEQCAVVREVEKQNGNVVKGWSFQGYKGFGCGRIHSGSRADTAIVCLSGDAADAYMLPFLDLATAVTRLDLAVTARFTPRDLALESRLYNQAEMLSTRPGAVVNAELRSWTKGGALFTWGSRSSERYLRVYDKEHESSLPRYYACHRAELELKGGVAEHTAHAPELHGDRAAYVQSTVHQFMRTKGLAPFWSAKGGVQLLPGFQRRSDVDTRLDWLRTQVAPAVLYCKHVGHGQDAFHALGFRPGETYHEIDPTAQAVTDNLQGVDSND